MLKAWATFFHERFPLLVYLAMCTGIALSTALLTDSLHAWPTIIFSTMSTMLFFLTLRIMDEYKDYEKDLVAHPHRPLPRGLISRDGAKFAISFLLFMMVVNSGVSFVIFGSQAFLLYVVVTAWLYLMFREFFVGDVLAKSPFLYAFTHQIILFPLILFSCALFAPLEENFAQKCFYVMSIFFTFFAFEIARKLDPDAPMILGTYWRVSGKARTSFCLITLLICGMTSAFLLFDNFLVVMVSLVTLLTFLLFVRRPQLFKLVEVASSVSLLVHIWSVGLWRLLV